MTGHALGAADKWYLLRVRRYLLAGIGPVALAGTHFLISFAMLRLDAPAAFGIFTFLFVAAQFTVAISAALFGAPLQALAASRARAEQDAAAAAIVTAAAFMAVVTGLAFVALSFVMGLWGKAALFYGLYSGTMIVRWVGRSWCYAADKQMRPALSDIIYAVVTLSTFAAAILAFPGVPESACYAALALGSTCSLLAFGRRYGTMLITLPSRRAWDVYRAIWHSQSRWALLGVATTEAVANAHIYLVTLFAGAEAVAPLAAAALMLRPINVVQNALIEYERPQMATLIGAGALAELRQTKRLFLGVLLVAWLGSSLLALGVVNIAPWLVFSPAYDLAVIETGSLLWVLVTLLILLQVPANVMLQAAGEFRGLARATIWSSVVSVIGVAVVLSLVDPVWTIAAIAIGWIVDLALVRRCAAQWRCRLTAPAAPRL